MPTEQGEDSNEQKAYKKRKKEKKEKKKEKKKQERAREKQSDGKVKAKKEPQSPSPTPTPLHARQGKQTITHEDPPRKKGFISLCFKLATHRTQIQPS